MKKQMIMCIDTVAMMSCTTQQKTEQEKPLAFKETENVMFLNDIAK